MKIWIGRIAGIVCGLFAIGLFTVAVAAYIKASDPVVLRNGFFEDYIKVSVIAAILGTGLAAAAVFILTRKSKTSPPSDSHF